MWHLTITVTNAFVNFSLWHFDQNFVLFNFHIPLKLFRSFIFIMKQFLTAIRISYKRNEAASRPLLDLSTWSILYFSLNSNYIKTPFYLCHFVPNTRIKFPNFVLLTVLFFYFKFNLRISFIVFVNFVSVALYINC